MPHRVSYVTFLFVLGFVIALTPLLCILGLLIYRLSFILCLGRISWQQTRRGYVAIEDDRTHPDGVVGSPQAYPSASNNLVNCNSLSSIKKESKHVLYKTLYMRTLQTVKHC
jgi:hypothetical protein